MYVLVYTLFLLFFLSFILLSFPCFSFPLTLAFLHSLPLLITPLLSCQFLSFLVSSLIPCFSCPFLSLLCLPFVLPLLSFFLLSLFFLSFPYYLSSFHVSPPLSLVLISLCLLSTSFLASHFIFVFFHSFSCLKSPHLDSPVLSSSFLISPRLVSPLFSFVLSSPCSLHPFSSSSLSSSFFPFGRVATTGKNGKGKRRCLVCMCTCLFTVHPHIYTPTIFSECAWQHVRIQTKFPLILLFIFSPAKNSSAFSFFLLQTWFLLHRLSLQNNNQTWALSELKQAPKLGITQTAFPNWQNLYCHLFLYHTQLSWHLRQRQWILHRLKQATYSLHQGSWSETETDRHQRSQLISDLRTPQGRASMPRRLNLPSAPPLRSCSTHNSETCRITYKGVCLMHHVDKLQYRIQPEVLEFLWANEQQKVGLLICQRWICLLSPGSQKHCLLLHGRAEGTLAASFLLFL